MNDRVKYEKTLIRRQKAQERRDKGIFTDVEKRIGMELRYLKNKEKETTPC